MKKPNLGTNTFLKDNTERIFSYERFIREIYSRPELPMPLYTGRSFMISTVAPFLPDRKEFKILMERANNIQIASSLDFKDSMINEQEIEGADVLIYEELGIALIDTKNEAMAVFEQNALLNNYILVPEQVVYVPNDRPEALNIPATWGLSQTKAAISQYSGNGVKVAVLDTGFDLNHPDFIGRIVNSASFVPGESVQDGHGHGTHCIGTACGNTDIAGTRYGIASNSHIYTGKVLSNAGSGAQAWILNGILWAANQGCQVISMSFGSPVFPGQGYDLVYERAGAYATSKGALLFSAAGNDSRRSMGIFNPIGSPANCPSFKSVAAIDENLNIADFSNRAINPGVVMDIAGPGVNVYSSWPLNIRYRTISGTSMATPHVAGIAALYWEQFPRYTPAQIWNEMQNHANHLPLPVTDVGAGLVIAP